MPSPQLPLTPVLIVTYYFPPSGGGGVQRTLKFVRHLRTFGYEPTVLTVEAGAYPSLDEGLWADVPEGVEVVRTPAPDPFGVYGRLSGRSREGAVAVGSVEASGSGLARVAALVRANVFLPDARVGWVPFARRAARRLVRERGIGLVLTSGPPHSAHLTGLGLGGLQGPDGRPVRWVADFRDPWTGINFYDELPMSRAARAFDARLERRVLRRADRVTTVSPTWAQALQARGGLGPGRVALIHNGYDADDFAGLSAVQPSPEAFWLAHVGSLYGSRNPESLWAALARLRTRGEASRLRIRLVGRVDASVHEALARHGLVEIALAEPYAPHREAVRAMAEAALLVLSIEPFRREAGMVTGKLYEYLASGRPTLALGPLGGDAAALLAETGGGALFARDDADGAEAFVLQHYRAWEAGSPLPGASPERVWPYSREAQTGRLAGVFRELETEA